MEVDLLSGADVGPPPVTNVPTPPDPVSMETSDGPQGGGNTPQQPPSNAAPPEVIVRKVFNAIRAGDLRALRSVFSQSVPRQVTGLLSSREGGAVLLRRPSNGREVYIRQPTPLILAVTEWFTEIVEYLAEFRVSSNHAILLPPVLLICILLWEHYTT